MSLYIFLAIKITFFITYFILFVIMSFSDLLFFRKNFKKIIFFLNKIRFFSPWNFFSDIDGSYYDILIIANSDKKEYLWRLRKDKKIGGIEVRHNLSRLTLAFYYKKWFAFILNDYFLNQIKDYISKNSEILEKLEIEQIWYDSFTEDIKSKNLIFSWQKT